MLTAGQPIQWVDQLRSLGVFIVRSVKFKCPLDQAKRNFYRSSNSIFGKVGRAASEEVVLHLIKTKCLPVLLYGLEVFSLTKADQRSLHFVVIRFLMKLLCTSNMVTINACLSYFDFTLLSELLLKRYERYLLKRGLS